ncbi:otoferlin-like, partial [Nilaparvata lugens]|uniref:otoferlin-like n=1 Tax=Nilaparvata lugens TaxID=108931 RepID=UPI00193E6E7E
LRINTLEYVLHRPRRYGGLKLPQILRQGSPTYGQRATSGPWTVYNFVRLPRKFEWPVARAVECHEVLSVQLYTHNRYLSDKLVGSYSLVLQKVVSDGRITVCDTLVDPNNKPLPATVDLEITYYSMDEASAAPSSLPSASGLDMDHRCWSTSSRTSPT